MYTPRPTLRPVNFICRAPEARAVTIMGDFNHWNPASHPMKQGPDKAWSAQVELKQGHHRYAFLVDGVLTLDPNALGITRNDRNERVSLLAVSGG